MCATLEGSLKLWDCKGTVLRDSLNILLVFREDRCGGFNSRNGAFSPDPGIIAYVQKRTSTAFTRMIDVLNIVLFTVSKSGNPSNGLQGTVLPGASRTKF